MPEDDDDSKNQGWGSQLVSLYETFFLRDVLGYIFPGVVLLLGLAVLCGGECPYTGRDLCKVAPIKWPILVVGLCVAYAGGVFIRLLGTWTHLLVISAVVGWFGDPWDLLATNNTNAYGVSKVFKEVLERPWKSRHEDTVMARYREMHGSSKTNLKKVRHREALFLHLAGNLGLAAFILFIFSMVGCVGWGFGHFPGVVNVLLFLTAAVLIPGSYRHARNIRLLHKASEVLDV